MEGDSGNFTYHKYTCDILDSFKLKKKREKV